MSRNMRQVLKRTTRMFLNKGITIDDVHLTPDVLVSLPKEMKLGCVDALSAALQRAIFISVPDAFNVLRAIVSCGSVDAWRMHQLDVSQRKQRSAMRTLHLFLKHARAYYFESTRTLLDRLQHAAAASCHVFDLQVAFAPLGPALYYGWQLEMYVVLIEVEAFHIDFLGEPFFMCHRGSDLLEGTFSVCRTGSGSSGCPDIVQLRFRFAIVVHMFAIYAKHPEWNVIRKPAATADNITHLQQQVAAPMSINSQSPITPPVNCEIRQLFLLFLLFSRFPPFFVFCLCDFVLLWCYS